MFEAARQLGIKNVVWASSETVLGLPFDTPPPYVPVDEEYPGRPESAYSLCKLVDETMAEQFCRWDPEQKIIGLRFSNVMDPEDYAPFPSFDADPRAQVEPVGLHRRAGRRAGRPAGPGGRRHGSEVFIIANADTVMSRPNGSCWTRSSPTCRGGQRRRERDAAVDRQGAPGARVRAAPQLAGRGR